ncbi:MAG: alpha/beta hydrolase [Clostridiales bacterium]|jgi:acetyl esterase|nr:alpha/beta hydrolase [Clostridiales bacterium]
MAVCPKNINDFWLQSALHGQCFESALLDINNCSIFLKRDVQKQKVRKTTVLKFKSIVNGDGFLIPTMLYDPEKNNKNLLLYFHGGGWVMGSIESHDCLCRKIANTLNIRVLSVEYRLAPLYKFPTALNDILSVYCSLFNNSYIDFDEVIVAGDSSGGNLCASLCIKLMEIKFKKAPILQILFYPVLSNDFSSNSFKKFGNEVNLTKSMMQWFMYMYAGKEFDNEDVKNNKLIYPLLQDDMSIFPETLLVSAENDVLLDGQLLFLSKLKKANVKANHLTIENAKHGFMTYGNKHWKFTSVALKKIKELNG